MYYFETPIKLNQTLLSLLPRCPDVSILAVRTSPFFNTFSFLIEWSSGLPTDARSEDVSKFFDGYGRIIDCRVMTGSWTNVCKLFYVDHLWIGFGFVEFENAKVRVAE
jgi:RNA recognition motif. (a.k.a. RRM, RBD, or RNP domain)